MSPQERFERISAELLTHPGIEEKTGFGSSPGLRADGRIFAMLDGTHLVLRLPAERCRGLLDEPHCRPYDRNQGRALRQWVVVGPERDDWETLTDEALHFVQTSAAGA
jgi:hypothetical protein